MTDKQKFLLLLGYKYCPQYEIKFDRDRDVMSLRVWLSNSEFFTISDVPSLIGTNKYQVRYCEQTKSYFSPSPRCGELDRAFGKKYRKPGKKYAVVDSVKLTAVLSSLTFVDKTKRNVLNEDAVWFNKARDVFF